MSGASLSVSVSPSSSRFAAAGTTAGALDIALAWDDTRKSGDLVWQNGDFALDTTPATAMLMALGCESRADPTDTLPDPAVWATPQPGQPMLLADRRRGWAGDALDPNGDRTGSGLWLYTRSKQIEAVRKGIESKAARALGVVQRIWQAPIQLTVRWIGPGAVGIRAAAGPVAVVFSRPLGG